MKKMFVPMLCVIGLAMGLPACYDDSADIRFYSGDQLIDQVGTCTNLISHVTLYLNGTSQTSVGIAYGKGGYQAVTSDVEVVKVGMEAGRLILTAGGKKGNAVVTVTDEKGNQASLTVESGTGAYAFVCLRTIISPMSANMEGLDNLKTVAEEALADYAPMHAKGRWVFVPEKKTSEAEQGELQVYDSSSAQPVVGTYVRSVAEKPLYEGMSPFIHDFSYGGESHHYNLAGSYITGRAERMFPFYFLEDVTERFHKAAPSVSLPEGAKIYYVVEFIRTSFVLQN